MEFSTLVYPGIKWIYYLSCHEGDVGICVQNKVEKGMCDDKSLTCCSGCHCSWKRKFSLLALPRPGLFYGFLQHFT